VVTAGTPSRLKKSEFDQTDNVKFADFFLYSSGEEGGGKVRQVAEENCDT
jgi:hypothetical protein